MKYQFFIQKYKFYGKFLRFTTKTTRFFFPKIFEVTNNSLNYQPTADEQTKPVVLLNRPSIVLYLRFCSCNISFSSRTLEKNISKVTLSDMPKSIYKCVTYRLNYVFEPVTWSKKAGLTKRFTRRPWVYHLSRQICSWAGSKCEKN